MEDLSKLRERVNAQLEKEKVRLSIADFVTKAVAATLVRHPALNARFNPEKNEITRHADVNLGMAVADPRRPDRAGAARRESPGPAATSAAAAPT